MTDSGLHFSCMDKDSLAPRHGVLVVDKPPGMTSAAVVARVKRILRPGKVGHTGTLDPMATGVLPICIGEGTKIAGYLSAEDKAYEGELLLGVATDTLDREGQVIAEEHERARYLSDAELTEALDLFLGDIEQVPPMYSAVKVAGRRLYEIARQGRAVERPSRSVRVDHFTLVERKGPRCRFRVACSKGTYVRTLVADLGDHLGCHAHLTALRRVRSGAFSIADAIALSSLEQRRDALIPPAQALAHLPQFRLSDPLAVEVVQGKPLLLQDFMDEEPPGEAFCLVTQNEDLLAIAEARDGRLRYRRVFTYGLTKAA